MSKQVDWSQAPEWASVLLKNVHVHHLMAWAESFDNGSMFLNFYGDGGKSLDTSRWRILSTRPSTPSWSGEGLPPVGVVCEVNPDKSGWRKSVISYIGNGFVAWLQVGDLIVPEYGAFIDDCEFRPIRTQEQIAADEREEAIKRACADIDKLVAAYNMSINCSAAIRATIEALHDAGYRKQEQS